MRPSSRLVRDGGSFRSPLGSGVPVPWSLRSEESLFKQFLLDAEVKGKMVHRVIRASLLGLVVIAGSFRGVAANHAIRVIAEDLVAGPGNRWTESDSLLGEPARETDDPDPVWGGIWPVDPFSGPHLPSQIMQLEAGSSVTLEMQAPILDSVMHLYGLDLLVFGNSFFQYNGDWTTTSGQLGGEGGGVTQVSVSQDGGTFYRLTSDTGGIDGWYPTDGAGDFGVPVNPGLGAQDFAGLDLEGIRGLYAGAGGGTGFDLSGAVDDAGAGVLLPWIRYVRLEQLSGKVQLDALSAVGNGRVWHEDFSEDPLVKGGWQVSGESSLFSWDESQGVLDVVWDSSKPNSYFTHSIGTVLSRVDDFVMAFDLRLDAIQPGATEGKPAAFQIALGLAELESIQRDGLARGAGIDTETGVRNVMEFDYFPDAGFGATVSPVFVSAENEFAAGFTYPVELPLGGWLTVVMEYSAAEGLLRTKLIQDGREYYPVDPVALGAGFSDFRFDCVGVFSYSDEGQNPEFPMLSVYAEGVLDNFVLELPRLPVEEVSGGMVGGGWATSVQALPGWEYQLEHSLALDSWATVDSGSVATPGSLVLRDPAVTERAGFYRVVALKP
jgi:hypothetical protein